MTKESLDRNGTALIFDKINYTVSLNNSVIKLQPLSFRLLETLASSPDDVIAVDTLIEAVWGNVTVSPDTLKQRIFVLRKAIEESELTGLSIQAIRGEGYRLLIESQMVVTEPGKFSTRRWHLPIAVAAVAAAILMILTLVIFPNGQSNLYKNNRVVLWSNMPARLMPAIALDTYETWRSFITTNQPVQNYQVIFSELQDDIPMSMQARKSRAALISLFEVVHQNDILSVRLSIIEGSTATVLRSELLTPGDPTIKQSMEDQLASIQALIASGKLSLEIVQRENAEDPVWLELKNLAQQKSSR